MIVPSVWRLMTICTSFQQQNNWRNIACQFYAAKRKLDIPENCCKAFETGMTIRRKSGCVFPSSAILQWCRLHIHWTEDNRASIRFTSEYRFNVSFNSRRYGLKLVVQIVHKICWKGIDMVHVASWYRQVQLSMTTPTCAWKRYHGHCTLHCCISTASCSLFPCSGR